MVIAFATERTDSWINPPVWGDERLARGLRKYLERLPDIARVYLLNQYEVCPPDVDVCIRLQPQRMQTARRTVLWYQSDHDYPLPQLAEQYGGLILASRYHRDRAEAELVGYPWIFDPVVCIDPEQFPVMPRTAWYSVVYLGNNIKGKYRTHRFLNPALRFGLRIFGSGWDHGRYAPYNGGPLKGMSSNAQLYANAGVVLSFHLEKHAEWDMPVCRTTEALCCGRIVLSDRVGMDLFDGLPVQWTDGNGETAAMLEQIRAAGTSFDLERMRACVFARFSMEQQAERLAAFCRELTS